MHIAAALSFAALLLMTGCGVPQEVSKQADDVASVAAEGALLAHDAGEGSTTKTFTREHAKALQKLVEELEPAIEEQQLGRVASRVAGALERLAEMPGDRRRAAVLEHELEEAARAAEALAG